MKTNVSASRCFIKAALLFSLVFLMSNLFLAQGNNIHTFATSQTNAVSAPCLGCSIQNPQNAVGNDPINYSSLKMGIGLLGKVEQTLIFPAISLQKLAIYVGTGNGELTAALLSAATIETMNGNVSNGDSRIIDSQILTINTWSDNYGVIQFRPTKPYDRVKISLNAGVLSLNRELRIYEAKQSAFVTSCTSLPGEPYLYYSFDGTVNDQIKETIHNYDLIPSPLNIGPPTFLDSLICGKALKDMILLESGGFNVSMKREKTISFWANTNGKLQLTIFDTGIVMTPDSLKITALSPDHAISKSISAYNPTSPELHHYSITTLPKFRTSMERILCEQQGGTQEGCSKPTEVAISIYVDGVIWSSFPIILQPDTNTSGLDNIKVAVVLPNHAIIDELLVYDEILSTAILRTLPCAYNLPQNCPSGNPTPSVSAMKTTPAENILTLSPNPTTGRITLDGNIPITGAEIFVNNTFGKEVYHEKLDSKTFDLPATLSGGVYILTLQTKDKKVYTRKIILTR
jgi:hypothetical protein